MAVRRARVDAEAYPWYDANWLAQYCRVREFLAERRPDVLPLFDEALRPLRTDPSFSVREVTNVLSASTLEELRTVVAGLGALDLDVYELKPFGRFIYQHHEQVSRIQLELVELVSELAGEPVEPSYNFLSMYTDLGKCAVHMDAPQAKWTLDVCIDQSRPWPIYISNVVNWPAPDQYSPASWEAEILSEKGLDYRAYTLEPGNGVLFSGSSQWHHREPHPGGAGEFCNLVFFHFVPQGTSQVVHPEKWADYFGEPAISDLI